MAESAPELLCLAESKGRRIFNATAAFEGRQRLGSMRSSGRTIEERLPETPFSKPANRILKSELGLLFT